MRSSIKPGNTARQLLDAELSALEVRAIHVGNFKLAPWRRLQPRSDIKDLIIVEVQAGDSVGRPRPRGLLLDADGPAIRIELHHAIALGIPNLISEHRRASLTRCRGAQVVREVRAVKQIVTERKRHPVGADELSANQK